MATTELEQKFLQLLNEADPNPAFGQDINQEFAARLAEFSEASARNPRATETKRNELSRWIEATFSNKDKIESASSKTVELDDSENSRNFGSFATAAGESEETLLGDTWEEEDHEEENHEEYASEI